MGFLHHEYMASQVCSLPSEGSLEELPQLPAVEMGESAEEEGAVALLFQKQVEMLEFYEQARDDATSDHENGEQTPDFWDDDETCPPGDEIHLSVPPWVASSQGINILALAARVGHLEV